jgi:glycosyltransferase involved in cell wall biosynthesis
MRIGVYDPYLDTLGGGEKYVLSIASLLSQRHQVDLFWDDPEILEPAQARFNLDLKKVKIIPNVFSENSSFLKKLKECYKYDVIFYVSDGSIPFLSSKKSFLIFQHPVNWANGKSLKNRIKLARVERLICYTEFVRKHLGRTFDKKIEVLFPPVEKIGDSTSGKKNVILTVGRFTKGMNRKKHEVLIDAFKKMIERGLKGWKLVIVGSYLEKDYDLVSDLEKSAQGAPVEILANASYRSLLECYKGAKIYWHAAGFGEDLNEHPEYAEHFGITTVEAMSAGAVPVVIKAGGQTEIVEAGKSGFLWGSVEELISQTEFLIKDKKLWEKISEESQKRAKMFSHQKFEERIEDLII